jgi:hypothetical protein
VKLANLNFIAICEGMALDTFTFVVCAIQRGEISHFKFGSIAAEFRVTT